MCIGLIGGMDRLGRHYMKEAERLDIHLKVFSKWEKNLSKKIKTLDALVVFTNKISHMGRKEVMVVARNRQIPIFMYHSCGVCTLRDCLSYLKDKKDALRPEMK